MAIRVFHRDEPSRYVDFISADARLVVWPGVGAEMANLNFVRLVPGEENTPHAHDESEDSIYILAGTGEVDDLTHGQTLAFAAGDVVHVPVGVRHAVKASTGDHIASVGGPCPPDAAMIAMVVED